MLSVALLGRLEVAWRGEPWPLPRRHEATELWLYLLLHDGLVQERSALAAELWPDAARAEGMAQLRRALHHLSQVLPPAPADRPWLVVDRQNLGWNPAAEDEVDVTRFWWLSRHLDGEASPDTATEPVLRNLATAAALYGGSLLPALDAPWLEVPRRAAHERSNAALAWLSAAYEARGALAEAVAYGERLVRQDPLWEPGQRRLIEALARAGDRGAALRQLQACRAVLARELGVAPAPATERLAIELGLHDAPGRTEPGAATAPTELVDRLGAVPPAPALAGRTEDLATLRAALAEARLVSLVGPVGCGKSALARAAAASPGPLFGGGCRWLDLAEVPDAGALRQALAPLLAGQIGAAADERPWLLALDNATHLLDACAETLPRLLGRLPQVTVLLTAQAPLGVAGERCVAIGPLGLRAAVALAARQRADVAGADAGPPLEALCRHLDCLPLAILLAASRSADGQWPTDTVEPAAPPDAGEPAWHGSMAAAYARSIGLLGPEARALLGALTGLSPGFGLAEVEALAGRSAPAGHEDPVASLLRLVARSLVWCEHGPDGTRYRLPLTLERALRQRPSGLV